jgi:hypothetical protein
MLLPITIRDLRQRCGETEVVVSSLPELEVLTQLKAMA